jgi:hypothetical protein
MESRPFHRVSRERFLFLFFKPEGVLEFGCVFFTCGWIRIECWKGYGELRTDGKEQKKQLQQLLFGCHMPILKL